MHHRTPLAEPSSLDLVPIGVVGRPFGLKGELRLRLFDPSSTTLFTIPSVLLRKKALGPEERYTLERVRSHQKETLVTFKELPSRTEVESILGALVLVEKTALPPAGPDEFYDFDLVGLVVRDLEGIEIGEVIAVEHPPAADVLVIREIEGGRLLDLPMVEGIVRSVNLADRVVLVDLPDGIPTREH